MTKRLRVLPRCDDIIGIDDTRIDLFKYA